MGRVDGEGPQLGSLALSGCQAVRLQASTCSSPASVSLPGQKRLNEGPFHSVTVAAHRAGGTEGGQYMVMNE